MNIPDLNKPADLAEQNLIGLSHLLYPGRIIIAGVMESGNFFQASMIAGRSKDSRNRKYEDNGADVSTALVIPDSSQDTSNTVYPSMMESGDGARYAVSNGHQTASAIERTLGANTLDYALQDWKYEPDPSNTPRITAVIRRNRLYTELQMSSLCKSPFSAESERYSFQTELNEPGFGYLLHTYARDVEQGVLLPAYRGGPILVAIPGDLNQCLEHLTSRFDNANCVAWAVKGIPIKASAPSKVLLWNKYQQTAT